MAGLWFTVAFLVAWSFQWHRGLRTHLEAAGLAWYMQHTQAAQFVHAGPESPDGGLGSWLPSCTSTSCTSTCCTRGARLVLAGP
eukprot:13404609-Alexandrium_andersonii.AAC.1